MSRGWKVFTHDLRPPIQGGDPVWGGKTPHTLGAVQVDRSESDCGAGWNFCSKPSAALRIAGLWPTGRPSRLFLVEPAARAVVVERGEKARASRLTIVREATADEVAPAVVDLSKVFAPHVDAMAAEQLAWREALARPHREPSAVETCLLEALSARGLGWKLRRFDSTEAARAARAAWDAWAAWAAWADRAARAAWAAWDDRAARDARAARAAWAAWADRAAWAARAALTLGFASRQRWVEYDADLLTRGLRDAYRNGLEIVIPTGPDELGWSMAR